MANEESEHNGKGMSRAERFKQLKKKAVESSQANRSDLYQEYKNSQTDPKLKAKMDRKKEEAEFELSKLDSKEKGEDFERKRAWDWTIEESERWDEKQEEKRGRMESSVFSDHSTAAEKAYLKEMKDFKPDLDEYQREKLNALKRDAILIEDENGKVIPYNKDGSVYEYDETKDSSFLNNKPKKAAVDRLVQSLKSNDSRRMKRRKKDDEEHVTYINEKNKQFNMKLSRHYDKYNKDIRDAFERGTGV